MLYKNILVKRPEGSILYRMRGKEYVYYTSEKIYLKEKKQNRNKRVCIGIMADDTNMNPNDNAREYFPDFFNNNVAPLFSDSLSIGLYSVMNKIMKELEIDELLNEIFKEDSMPIKDLMEYMISESSTVIQHFPGVMRRIVPFSNIIYSDSYYSSFFKDNITSKKIELFLSAWNKLNVNKDTVYISYDSTNMNSHSSGIELAEYGHAKDDEGLPQVNLSYAINQKESLPLFYELYPGSIIDNSQVIHMINQLKDYGYANIGVILDRGYFSKNNIDFLEKNGYDYVLMVKTSQDFVSKVIKEKALKFINNDNYFIEDHDVYGYTVNDYLYPKSKKKVYIHLYFDPLRAANERFEISRKRIILEEELNNLDSKLKRQEDLLRYSKYFKLTFGPNGYFMSFKRNEKYIKELIDSAGYFCIVTSRKMSAKEALDTYRDRDTVEKLFESLKSELDYKKFRVNSDSALAGKTFITFLANIVRSRIYYNSKKLKVKNKKDYTVPAIINELNNIEVTKNAKDIYIRKYGLTARQKNILTEYKIKESDIDSLTKGINKRLSDTK